MSSVCADHLFSPAATGDPPPRKQLLLTRHTLFNPLEFLPSNSHAGDDSGGGGDPYSSDYFRMFEFKIRRCTRSRSHDWTECPFAHPGEKARRRDPRRYHYSGAVCPEFRRTGGCCSRGDDCEFAHGVFEVWLHPARYRTEACKDGRNCGRKVCFFAHTQRQLRVLPPSIGLSPPPPPPPTPFPKRRRNPICKCNRCCSFCRSSMASSSSSPTSTLTGVSNFSPPLSPTLSRSDLENYTAVLTELLSSLEGVSIDEATSPVMGGVHYGKMRIPWIDVCSNGGEDEKDFVGSPCGAPNPAVSSSGDLLGEGCSRKCIGEEKGNNESGLGYPPDLDWVNDLLM